ncbi:hypothetical protein CSUB01_09768 [Colletotrichum sublineola]|uniref:Uncharacterized protein n=1 Tax=Colletotrichum sublineola TaxID=1173701 RepID=A0A066WTS0_COLSU|nr:hypothetical protein CSUB01_09768 [Colletotrichum sublineola]
MTLITDLPCELVAGIETEIVRRHVTPALIPYAFAAVEAHRLPRPREGADVQLLLNTLHDEPAQLTARFPSMPRALLQRMARTHDVIYGFAYKFATEAWHRFHGDEEGSTFTSVTLSPTEYFRFCRAFYRVELFYNLFSEKVLIVDRQIQSSGVKEGINPWFFSKHTPWENEQLGCVHDFLEAELAKASFEVVAHDVNFALGESLAKRKHSALLLAVVRMTRKLSQGINFLHRLICEISWDKKRELLKLSFDTGDVNLPLALFEALEDRDDIANVWYEDDVEEKLHLVMPEHKNEEDVDRGPYEAWYPAHKGLPIACSFMDLDNDWLRKRAYVLWDWDRIERHHLLEIFQGHPVNPRLEYTQEEWQEMQESFNERSLIWQKGGSGYWSKGDTSRIVWPHQRSGWWSLMAIFKACLWVI